MFISTTWQRRQPAVRSLITLIGALSFCLVTSCGDSDEHPEVSDSGTAGPIAPLASSGRWLTDAEGRVVILHGFNEVAKVAPYYPAAFGFGEDDAVFLAEEGFNVLRLGVDFRGLMPVPGQVEEPYIDQLAETVALFAKHGIFVLLDFHQDGFGPLVHGNGFPEWMTITDGLPNPAAPFPTYYIQNPALQRAFEHFWANSAGPNGVGLQDYFVQALERVVTRFASNPIVLGYELMNEPWPGSAWQPCITSLGCPKLEQQLLRPFYEKATAAAHRIATRQFVFVEPFVLFNFGLSPTSEPGADSGNAFSFHSYASNIAGEVGVVAHAVTAAERDNAPLIATEFGATLDAVVLNRLTGELEDQLLPWIEWSYDGTVIARQMETAGPDNLLSTDAFDALVRPYPVAVTGTPTKTAFDPTTKVFDFAYDTVRPGGGSYAEGLVTVVSVPKRHYPNCYATTVEGATVTSAPCATRLTLRNQRGAASVSVRIAATPSSR